MKLYRLIDENNPGEIEYIATPIEITEKEIEEIVQDMAQDDEYGEWGRDCAREGIRMVLSKLKNE